MKSTLPADQGCRWAPPGWWCSRRKAHGGPCALRPRWWNLPARRRFGSLR